jgi:iron complex outermembrane recepter protein
MRGQRSVRGVRASLLLSACLFGGGLSDVVWAQDAGGAADGTVAITSDKKSAKDDEILVTGYAASLQRALATKRKLDVISDGISAEDIGKYPEQNIAESLQRVTGVQITRSLGDGQFLSVRGLDPKFTDTLYNGRQLPTASGSRAFDFQVLTANFASQVDVYKSPSADLQESGLAATVNMQSIDPLTYGKQKISLAAEGIWDQQARGAVRPHVSALYTNTFLDHRLGWSIGFDYNERNLDDQQFATDGVLGDSSYTGPGKQYRVYGLHQNDMVGTDKRISFASTLHFQASDNLDIKFDTIWTRFEQKYNYYQGNNWYTGAGALGPSPTSSETVNSSGVETAWSGSNVFAWVQANLFDFTQHMTSNALSASLKMGAWTLNGEVSYGRAIERTTQLYVSWATSSPGASLAYDANADPGGPISFNFTNGFNPLDPSHYYFFGVQGSYAEPTTDQIWDGKLNISRPLHWGPVRAVKFGLDAEDRTLTTTPNGIADTTNGFASDMSQYLMVYSNPTYFSSYHGAAQFPRTYLTVNLNKFFSDYPILQIVANNPPQQVLSSTTRVEERSLSGYGMLTLGNDSGRLHGNIGVRFVHTEELSSGYIPTPDAQLVYGYYGGNTLGYSAAALQAQSNTYDNVLPSLNLAWQFGNNLVLRTALARVMQRPDMNQLAAASTPNASTGPTSTPWIGTLAEGNPNLKPYLANQFDVSLEWYFGKRSLIAADFFLKDVKNLVLTNYFNKDTSAVTDTGTGATQPITLTVAQPQNAPSTTIKGVELGYQQPFEFFKGFLHWFGVQANWTHIWYGSVVLNAGQPAEPLTGVSANTYNLGGYFDNGRFAVHLGYNYRSRYVQDPLSYFGDGIFVEGYGQLDASTSFQINHVFSVNASVSNLTQSALRETDRYGITRLYDLSGRRFTVGVRAMF